MNGQWEPGRKANAGQRVLRPFRHLILHGFIAILALTTPVFAVLYWLALPDGPWVAVLVVHVVVLGLTVLCVYAFFSTTITLGPEGVRERGYFGRTVTVRPADAGAIVLVRLYESSTLDTLPQLFVTDKNGGLLIRMRGQFWSLEDMERVAEELDTPVTRPEESLTLTQLRRTSPELLYWFERGLPFR